MSKRKSNRRRPGHAKPQKQVRVRSKRLDEIDETKLALAFWLMAKRQLEEQEAEKSAP